MPQTQVGNDTRTLRDCFRSALADVPHNTTPDGFSVVLRDLVDLLRDDFGAAGLFVQQMVEEHGPQAVLKALSEAYDAPNHDLGELEGD
jgi:hypothetical protein